MPVDSYSGTCCREAFRNYFVLGAGFNWAIKDWDECNTWAGMSEKQALWLAGGRAVGKRGELVVDASQYCS